MRQVAKDPYYKTTTAQTSTLSSFGGYVVSGNNFTEIANMAWVSTSLVSMGLDFEPETVTEFYAMDMIKMITHSALYIKPDQQFNGDSTTQY